MKLRMPSEWQPQDAILITWPHEHSAWQTLLPTVEGTYIELVSVISHSQDVLIQLHHSVNMEAVVAKLQNVDANLSHCHFIACDSNDTWARDHGPISVLADETPKLLNFTFNGWGNKFAASLDNQLNTRMHDQGVFNVEMLNIDWVLEGGSLEVDDDGVLMTTSTCLLNPNRNPTLNQPQIEEMLEKYLGVEKVLWLEHGDIEGDDTDAHIDTLARFAPNNTIVFQGCQDADDSHFESLNAMKRQLEGFSTLAGEPYRLVELPLPSAVYAEDGHRLPATYANFLITNERVIVPFYNDKNDQEALRLIQEAIPDRVAIGINALPLIEEHGSIHCITMQLLSGTINTQFNFKKPAIV